MSENPTSEEFEQVQLRQIKDNYSLHNHPNIELFLKDDEYDVIGGTRFQARGVWR